MKGKPDVSKLMSRNGNKPKENSAFDSKLSEKIGALKNPPDFIRDSLQLHYYHSVFEQVKENGTVLNMVDSYGLGMLAINLALVDECIANIGSDGVHMTVQGDRKMVTKKNPSVDLLDKAQANVRFYLREFKMTPNSRGKAATGVPGTNPVTDDGFDDL